MRWSRGQNSFSETVIDRRDWLRLSGRGLAAAALAGLAGRPAWGQEPRTSWRPASSGTAVVLETSRAVVGQTDPYCAGMVCPYWIVMGLPDGTYVYFFIDCETNELFPAILAYVAQYYGCFDQYEYNQCGDCFTPIMPFSRPRAGMSGGLPTPQAPSKRLPTPQAPSKRLPGLASVTIDLTGRSVFDKEDPFFRKGAPKPVPFGQDFVPYTGVGLTYDRRWYLEVPDAAGDRRPLTLARGSVTAGGTRYLYNLGRQDTRPNVEGLLPVLVVERKEKFFLVETPATETSPATRYEVLIP